MDTMTEPTQDERHAAASSFLNEEDAEPAAWDDRVYGLGEDWLILTDEEADELAAENIERDLWAFNASFLVSYMPDGMTEEALTKMSETLCEDASPAYRSMLGDRFEDVVNDAIASDGRGHFLSQWDGAEHEFEHNGRTWYAYRN